MNITGSPQSAGIEKETRQVEGELNLLMEYISCCEKEMNELTSRLHPIILSRPECEAVNSKEPKDVLAPLAEVIKMQSHRLRGIISSIKYLQSSVQI